MSHDHGEENAAGGTNAKTNNAEGENDTENQSILCLPKVDRQTLLVRNLKRLLQTGRYIPSNAIAEAMVRVESLLASAAAEANKEYPKEDDNGVTETKFSLSRAKFRLDYVLAKLAGYRLNADRTVSSTHDNGQGSRNNGQFKRNNYQAGRGDYRNRNQSGRYNGGRSRGYGGRGGRSSSYSGNNQNHDRQEHQRSYGDSGRGSSQVQQRESSRWQPPRQRTDNVGRGNYYQNHGGQRFERSNDERESNGRGWSNHRERRNEHFRGRGREDTS